MSWLALPLFLIGVVIFCQIYDLLVGLGLVAVLAPLLGSTKPRAPVPPGAVCAMHQGPASDLCSRCGRFTCDNCTVPNGDVLVCAECAERFPAEPLGSKAGGRAVWILLLASFVVRGLPVGAAIAIGEKVRPERWFAVWLIAGMLAAQPRASAPNTNKDLLGIWIGRLVTAGAVIFGAFVPEAMPNFIWWIAKKLVF